MADLTNVNRIIQVKKYEHQKLIAMAQIQAREIRIMELEEEMGRCRTDIELQKKIIVDMEGQIAQQKAEMEKGA